MGRVAATAVFLFFRMGFLLCDHKLDFNLKKKNHCDDYDIQVIKISPRTW